MFDPFRRNNAPSFSDMSPDQMRELMRRIAGKASVGEREPQMMARAQRRLNSVLPNNLKISNRRARGYWSAEYHTVHPAHAAAANDAVSILPVEEALDAIEEQISAHEECLRALLRSREDLVRHYRGNPVHSGSEKRACSTEVLARHQDSNPAGDAGLNSSRGKQRFSSHAPAGT